MVGSMKTRGKTAAMAKSATAQSHSTHDPATDVVVPPPLTTAPPTGPAAGSSNLHGTATEHGGTSHQASSEDGRPNQSAEATPQPNKLGSKPWPWTTG
ncbi:unnamed protein product [Prunus brigantina]